MAMEYKKVHDPKREILTFYMCMVCKSIKFYVCVLCLSGTVCIYTNLEGAFQ